MGNKLSILTKGIIKENPVLVLVHRNLSNACGYDRSYQWTWYGCFYDGGAYLF